MTDAPKRIWAEETGMATKGGQRFRIGRWIIDETASHPHEYILASEVAALIAEAEARGMERAAKLLDKRIESLVADHGSHEWDTNVTNLPEWVETATEELEAQAAAIRRCTTVAECRALRASLGEMNSATYMALLMRIEALRKAGRD